MNESRISQSRKFLAYTFIYENHIILGEAQRSSSKMSESSNFALTSHLSTERVTSTIPKVQLFVISPALELAFQMSVNQSLTVLTKYVLISHATSL